MRSWLLYEDRELSSQGAYPFQKEIEKDFNLQIIFKTMARENQDIYEAVRKVMLTPLHTKEEVLYRQEIIKDGIKRADIIGQVQHICNMVNTSVRNRKGKSDYERAKLVHDLQMLENLVEGMEQVTRIFNESASGFASIGFKRLFQRVNEYKWGDIRNNLSQMDFLASGGELTISLGLGRGLKMESIQINHCKKGNYKKASDGGKTLTKMLHKVTNVDAVYIEDELTDQEVRMLKQGAMIHLLKHYEEMMTELEKFFHYLEFELNFILGCSQLYKRFEELGIPFTMPVVHKDEQKKCLNFQSLYEITLAIYSRKMPVPNDVARIDKKLYVITGANQGGKSTFLRSIGIAQLMMQCGMYVPAKYYMNRLYDNILTHFTRREDQQLNQGRLEEEVSRMDKIVSVVTKDSMILLNESFASTTEKEGSLIIKDIVQAFYEYDTDVFMVTHLFEFARKIHEEGNEQAVFLTAERKEDGIRTFKMIEHKPDHTSYGLDLFEQIIGAGGV